MSTRMTDNWTFEIPGPPVAKQRPRRGPGGTWYTPKATHDAERHVAECAMVAGVRMEPKHEYSIEIDLHMSAIRDVDNCAKLILDGLQGMGDGWDDRHVRSLLVRRVSVRDGSEEKTVVRIEGLGE